MSAFRDAVAAHRMTLEEILRRGYARGVANHALRVCRCDGERLVIEVHPTMAAGDTLRFVLHDNHLTLLDNKGPVV